MGYKNFQSVRSIVLPFVLAISMTAGEYKEEYGIDVNTLDMYDKIFVKGEDNVTAPVLAIDKENKILYTAEKAFSYDDEFKELDTSLVNEMLNGGAIDTLKVNKLTSNEDEIVAEKPVVEVMEGYSFESYDTTHFNISYVGVVKNGNKLTIAIAGTYTRDDDSPANSIPGYIVIPKAISDKLFDNSLGSLDDKQILFMDSVTSGITKFGRLTKYQTVGDYVKLQVTIYATNSSFTVNTPYEFRYEVTFLLSENLAI